MRVLELFGGIGACTTALRRIGVDVEVADYVEIDKYAVASYNAINGTNFEPQDICTWDKNIEVDLIMHGSPCQDFSVAGKQAGGDVGSGTRSSLMYETIRIVGKLRPKYVVWENVKNLLSAKHRHNFDAYLETMKALGYTNYYQVLNAKDYGIPQNRERVFTISILGNKQFEFPQVEECKNKVINPLKGKTKYGWHFEQAVYDENGLSRSLKAGGGSGNIPKVIKEFEFPCKSTLTLRLKDLLEDEVDEKYYLSQRMIDFFYKNEQVQKEKGNGFRFGVTDGNVIAKAVTTRAGGRMDDNFIKCQQVGTLDMKGHDCLKRVYSDEGLSPTLTDMQGGNRQPKTMINNRIRKLTPKECWRLMGFSDEDFEKAAKVNSNTQLYKQAGNSIVVNVLEAIFKRLF